MGRWTGRGQRKETVILSPPRQAFLVHFFLFPSDLFSSTGTPLKSGLFISCNNVALFGP